MICRRIRPILLALVSIPAGVAFAQPAPTPIPRRPLAFEPALRRPDVLAAPTLASVSLDKPLLDFGRIPNGVKFERKIVLGYSTGEFPGLDFHVESDAPFLVTPTSGRVARAGTQDLFVRVLRQEREGNVEGEVRVLVDLPGRPGPLLLTAKVKARVFHAAAKNGHPVSLNGGPPKIKEAYWNGWVREQGQAEAAETVVRSRSYDVNFDLAAYDFAGRGFGAASAAVDPTFLKELNDVTGDTLPIVVKPFLLGRGLTFQPGRAKTQSLDLKLERLRKPPADFTRADPLPVFADKVSALRVTVGVEATGSGCAAVGLSIWNAAANRPLDYVVREIPVSDPEAPGPPPGCGTGNAKSRKMTGRLVSLLATRTQQTADAAFHLFEIKVADDEPASVAVFMRKGDNPAALSWKLSRSLSEYVSSPTLLLERLADARTRHDYAKLSEELTGVLLPRTALRVEDQAEVDEARRSLDEVLRTAASPYVFVRLVDVQGKSLFLPLGLVRVGDRLLAQGASILQPLPREDPPVPGRCIGPWTMVLPESLGDDVVNPRFLAPVPPVPADRVKDWGAFTTYLKGTPADPSKAEGFLLLAHHGGGRLAFVPNRPDSLLSDEITRRFPPGSVAVLAACSVGQLTGDNRGLPLLTRLNDLGVDAAILSPFAVEGPFGARFAMHFAATVQKAKEARETPPPNLGTLFRRAVEGVRADPDLAPLADEAFEFILAGNAGISLCP
jgi:hypothetical protein